MSGDETESDTVDAEEPGLQRIIMMLPNEVAQALHHRCVEENTTMSVVVEAALQMFLEQNNGHTEDP